MRVHAAKNLLSGLAMLFASALAGLLWDRLGQVFTFGAGALFCGLARAGIACMPQAKFGSASARHFDQR